MVLSEEFALAAAIDVFSSVVALCDPHAQIEAASEDVINQIEAHLPLGRELRYWYRRGAPLTPIVIPQFGNDTIIYSVNALVKQQDGYRWVTTPTQQRKALSHWVDTWVVIADNGADPIIANTAVPGTPVLFSYHGSGKWDTHQIAPTLSGYLHAQALWMRICLLETHALQPAAYGTGVNPEVVWDEDGNLLPILQTSLRQRLLPLLTPQELAFWLQ